MVHLRFIAALGVMQFTVPAAHATTPGDIYIAGYAGWCAKASIDD